ncbi:hypothetical protein BB560_004124 [Smittium megazygosporum]|uniref:Uncharacterized protein n=1 Tax=Smittium megazygosporum TaxID=133381 RepID=A0A2T9ZA62_9FUNG|nr:hypothetical protein BB560_004124 [Smittium megazygosporum]
MPEMDIFTDTSDTAWGYMWADILIQKIGTSLKHQLYSDNMTTSAYVKKFYGTTSSKLLKIPKDSEFGSKKLKVAFIGKQTLESHSMENHRRVLKDQGLISFAIDIAISNKQSQKQKSLSAPEIVNFLAELFTLDKLKLSTLKAYKSAVLLLSENMEKIGKNNVFVEFFRALEDSTIKSFVQPRLYISSIIKNFKYWDPASNISYRDQTAKL